MPTAKKPASLQSLPLDLSPLFVGDLKRLPGRYCRVVLNLAEMRGSTPPLVMEEIVNLGVRLHARKGKFALVASKELLKAVRTQGVPAEIFVARSNLGEALAEFGL